MPALPIITLTTDFGLDDYYVAAVRGTLLRLAPGAILVDVGHLVPAGDIAAGARLLAAAVPAFPLGCVHLAVIDPSVGSPRRILAVHQRGRYFVAPDNGLLTPFLADGGSDLEVRSVADRDLFLPAPGSTFHGRDRFAPVAAYLARGETLDRLGPVAGQPVLLAEPEPRREGDRLEGRVIHIDRFGNLVTDLPAEWLEGRPANAELAGHAVRHLVGCYAELPPGEPGLLVGSQGTLELSLKGASLAAAWGVRCGQTIWVKLG